MERSMQSKQIREALNAHWHAAATGDADAEHDIDLTHLHDNLRVVLPQLRIGATGE
jgi:hypothetical protein